MKHFQQEQCQKHNQKALFLNKSAHDPSLQSLCLQCVSELQNELIFIDDFKILIQNLLINLITERELLNLSNLNCLIDIKECLLQFKQKQIISIEKYVQIIEQQINIMDEFQQQMQSIKIPIENADQFFIQYTQVEKLSVNYEGIKDQIQNNLKLIQNDDFMPQVHSILNNMIFESETDIYITLSQLKSQLHLQNQQKEKLEILCDKHNSQIIMLDLNKEKTIENRLACLDCIEEYPIKFTKLENFEQQWKDYYKTQQLEKQKLNERITLTNQIVLQLIKDFLKNYQIEMKNIQQQLIDATKTFNNKLNQQIFKSIFQTSKEEIIKFAEELSKSNKEDLIKEEIESQFNNFKITSLNILNQKGCDLQKQYNQTQNEIQKQYLKININQTSIITNSQTIQPCNYQLMKQNCIKSQESCYALAFNNDSSIFIAGCNSKIKIYQFINEQLNEKQIVSEHKDDVRCLMFMKNSNHFLSGSKDQSIIIWEIDDNNLWFCKQRLIDHTERITCLIVNDNDDLLITSCWDKSIKFYNKTKKWEIYQTITEQSEQVWSISLNPSQNKLIACGNDKTILVLEQKRKDIKWIVIQKIIVEVRGYRLCFINDVTFAFQPWISQQMNVYQLKEDTNQFQKKKDVKVRSGNSCDYLSPLLYLSSQSLIINKNGFHINFIRKYQEDDFQTVFSIPFNTNYAYVTISRDGQFLATWDNYTQEIQIRKIS